MARHKLTNQNNTALGDQVDPVVGAMTHGGIANGFSLRGSLVLCVYHNSSIREPRSLVAAGQ